MTKGSPINSLIQPVLGRLVKRAVASMEEYQSKKDLPRLASENVVTDEDEVALSRALGGTTRLVSHKQGSNASRCGTSETESLPPSTPRDIDSPRLGTKGLPIEWQHTWGQVPQDVGHPHSTYPMNLANLRSVTMEASVANWRSAQLIHIHDTSSASSMEAFSYDSPPRPASPSQGNDTVLWQDLSNEMLNVDYF